MNNKTDDEIAGPSSSKPSTSSSGIPQFVTPRKSSVSHKGNISAIERARQYKNCHADGGKLFCTTCNKILDHSRKSSIDDHMKSQYHISRVQMKSPGDDSTSLPVTKKQKTVASLFKTTTIAASERVKVASEWCTACMAANIPLEKSDHPAIRKFLDNRVKNGGAIPGSNMLREKYLQEVYVQEKEQLRILLGGKKLSVIFDEMSDDIGRFVLNVLVAPVEEKNADNRLKSYLLDTCFLTVTNHATVSQTVIKVLQGYNIEFNDVISFDTDNAAYMKKAFTDILSPLFPNAVHITCLAHILNLVGQSFQKNFKEVNEFVKAFNAQFYLAGARKGRYLQYLKDNGLVVKLCPNPVATRWNSFYFAVGYHVEYFSSYKLYIANEMGVCGKSAPASVLTLHNIFQNEDNAKILFSQLKFINGMCKPLLDMTDTFQSHVPCTLKAYEKLEELVIHFSLGNTLTESLCEEYGYLCNLNLLAKQQNLDLFKSALLCAEDKIHKYLSTAHDGGQPGIHFLKAVRIFNPIRCGVVSSQKTDYFAIPGFDQVPDTEFNLYVNVLALEAKAASVSGLVDIDNFWNSVGDRVPHLTQLAKCYKDCVTNSADAERSFSLYNIMFSERRRSLSENSIKANAFLYYNLNVNFKKLETDSTNE